MSAQYRITTTYRDWSRTETVESAEVTASLRALLDKGNSRPALLRSDLVSVSAYPVDDTNGLGVGAWHWDAPERPGDAHRFPTTRNVVNRGSW
jgi:hypothetical protein